MDFISGTEPPVQSVEDFKLNLKSSLEDAQFSYRVSKARQASASAGQYKVPTYKVGSKLWINETLFTDAYSRSQDSEKLSAKRVGPFVVTKLIGRNAVRLDLPPHFKIHPVVHVIHTTPFVEQPRDIAPAVEPKPAPVPTVNGDEQIVDKILNHRRRGKGFQFLTLMKGAPIHDAEWQPTRDFVDKDGTVTKVWQEYIRQKGILPQHQ